MDEQASGPKKRHEIDDKLIMVVNMLKRKKIDSHNFRFSQATPSPRSAVLLTPVNSAWGSGDIEIFCGLLDVFLSSFFSGTVNPADLRHPSNGIDVLEDKLVFDPLGVLVMPELNFLSILNNFQVGVWSEKPVSLPVRTSQKPDDKGKVDTFEDICLRNEESSVADVLALTPIEGFYKICKKSRELNIALRKLWTGIANLDFLHTESVTYSAKIIRQGTVTSATSNSISATFSLRTSGLKDLGLSTELETSGLLRCKLSPHGEVISLNLSFDTLSIIRESCKIAGEKSNDGV